MSGKKLRVALVMGGKSREREVSLASGREVLNHMDRDRFEVATYDPAEDLVRLAEDAPKLDVAFLALHGPLGEDGTMQGFCEMLGLPYTGSGVLSSAMAMDKEFTKRLYRESGLTVAPDLVIHKRSVSDMAETAKICLYSLGSPLVVKPVRQGSSVGMAIVDNEAALGSAMEAVFELEDSVLLEKYLPGQEFTCAVVGNQALTALPVIEVIPATGHRFFDYQAKYEPGQAQEICPAKISARLTEEIQQLAIAAHEALSCRGYSRSDMIYSEGQVHLLETNTLPGLTAGSLVPKMVAAHGLSFTAFISYIIDLALNSGDVDFSAYKS